MVGRARTRLPGGAHGVADVRWLAARPALQHALREVPRASANYRLCMPMLLLVHRVPEVQWVISPIERMPTLKRNCTSGCIKPTFVSSGQLTTHWLGSVRTGSASVRSASVLFPRRGSKLCHGRDSAGIAKSMSKLELGEIGME